jgi:hypothetical protein
MIYIKIKFNSKCILIANYHILNPLVDSIYPKAPEIPEPFR